MKASFALTVKFSTQATPVGKFSALQIFCKFGGLLNSTKRITILLTTKIIWMHALLKYYLKLFLSSSKNTIVFYHNLLLSLRLQTTVYWLRSTSSHIFYCKYNIHALSLLQKETLRQCTKAFKLPTISGDNNKPKTHGTFIYNQNYQLPLRLYKFFINCRNIFFLTLWSLVYQTKQLTE